MDDSKPIDLSYDPTEPILVQVDQDQLMFIVMERNTYHEHVCKVMAALPIVLAKLPKVQWMGLFGSLDINLTSLINPFGKKKKVGITPEKLKTVFAQLIAEHPQLQTPISDLVNFYLTYQHINAPGLPDGSSTE